MCNGIIQNDQKFAKNGTNWNCGGNGRAALAAAAQECWLFLLFACIYCLANWHGWHWGVCDVNWWMRERAK
jgi:hypothetical protein